MKSQILIIGLIFAFEPLLGVPTAAAQKSHRPWLMIRRPNDVRSNDVRPNDVRPNDVRPNDVRPNGVRPNAVQLTPDGPGPRIAQQAMKYRGTRYRFGGNSKWGMDCSGLISRVYDDLKMKRIPRASAALYNSGNPVTLSDLRPGDLVFFKNTYRRGISHVGVYAGHNKFVHASNHRRGVTVTALSDPYYQLHYAGARRLY